MMKVEKSIDKKASIPLKNDAPSVLKAYAKYKDHKIGIQKQQELLKLKITKFLTCSFFSIRFLKYKG